MTDAPPERDAGEPDVDAILATLRRGEPLDDDTFDALYAPRWQVLSSEHWTPVEVADIAVPWLTERGARRVLDVGAGVGKLCVYGALITDDVTFVGIEQREELALEARRVAARLGVADRVEIRHATLESVEPREFQAIYLYNPFAENLADDPIDRKVELGRERFTRDVAAVERWLPELPVESRLVTFHGFGGWVPDSFRLVASKRIGWDALRAWEKHRPGGIERTAYAETRRG